LQKKLAFRQYHSSLSFFPEEDKYGTYAKLLIKYFLAEGIVSGHSLIVASQDYDCETLVCYV
jgi:hypothetical protein